MNYPSPKRGTPELRDLIRHRRLELGMTQEELAAATEMSQRWVSNLETGGVGFPRQKTMVKLARALQLPVEDLVLAAQMADTKDGAARVADTARTSEAEDDDSPLTPEEREFLSTAIFSGLNNMTPRKLRELIRIIQETE